MEIIENGSTFQEHGTQERYPATRGIISVSTRSEVEGSAFVQTLRELFGRDHNPFALWRRSLELERSRWRAAHGRRPIGWQNIKLLLRSPNPMYLVRQRYLDNYRDRLERWERGRVTDIVCALDKLGRTPLGKAGNRTFRVIRSIERMIDNLAYPGGPDLGHEQVRASTYNYIFAAPYDRRFAALTPEELCYRLREAGVSEMDLQAQSYEQILCGRPASLYRLAPLSGGKGYAFRPICSCLLSVGPDGTFPLQTDFSRRQDALLDKRHYSIVPKPSKPARQKKSPLKSMKKKPQGVKRLK